VRGLWGLQEVTRPRTLQKQIEDLQSDVESLRISQDQLQNTMRLQGALAHTGLEVLGYGEPARYELGHVTQCELCGELFDVTERGFELKLRSKAWGPRYGYAHWEWFNDVTRTR
jgi:hypothetical protein